MGFLTYLQRDIEQILFPDRDPHAIPSMDGAFSPNDRLDEATPVGDALPGADAVAEAPDGAIVVSGGETVWRLSGANYANRAVVANLDSEVGALAVHPDGRLLACTARGLAAIEPATGRTIFLGAAEGVSLRCLTAVAVAPDGSIFVSDGSACHAANEWCVDLMERNALGRLVACDASLQNARMLLRGLNYPCGLAVVDGNLWFTESLAHRLSRAPISAAGAIGAPQVVIRNMPGYPSRLGRSANGGFWLSLFGVRTHLIEFVLREDDFREEMMRTIPPEYWIAPALSSNDDCLEPMQFGGIKALGIQKPWAPPRSYGLVARLDANGEAVESLHSRVGGRYHGITAAIETPQGLIVVSKGSGRILLHRRDAQT
jgi:SMP-30/Gluconolactonase/LRE-like region